jgi:predicted Zn-ribbon and HTH transcriptional regulator
MSKDTGTPFIVHCRACGHEWTAAYLPMAVHNFINITKAIRCPACASDRINCGPNPKPSTQRPQRTAGGKT